MDEIKKSQKVVEYVEKEWIYLEYAMYVLLSLIWWYQDHLGIPISYNFLYALPIFDG
jgi:hypothetical protein